MQQPGNARTIFVVQVDNNKDLSDAKRYGQLRAVFGSPRKPYDAERLVAQGRRVLREYQPGDYLLMLGDPALCGVAMALAAEYHSVVNVLSWDRNYFRYVAQRWDFEAGPPAGAADDEDGDNGFPPADD